MRGEAISDRLILIVKILDGRVIIIPSTTGATAMTTFSTLLLPVALAGSLALISLGGGLYEFSVVDPSWPRRLDLIQPSRGGISRRRFWIPTHVAFELSLVTSLILAWAELPVRFWLLIALASHAAMRLWSAFDFIPKALAFERADAASFTESAARRWTHRSLMRMPLDLITCGALLAAIAQTARLG
jgi:hypothetical protein